MYFFNYSQTFLCFLKIQKKTTILNQFLILKTDLFTFINNEGGGLGLFMGKAFPNLIEFLQFIFEILIIVFDL